MSASTSPLEQAGRLTKPSSLRFWFWFHLLLGWIASVPLVLVCATGAVLAFEQELHKWENPPKPHAATVHQLSAEDVVRRLVESGVTVNHLQIPAEPGVAFRAYASELSSSGKSRSVKLDVDPETGAIVRPANRWSFTETMINLHRRLALGKAGQTIVAISSVILTVTSIAGVILWWPMRRRLLSRLRTRGNMLDWHNVIGLTALLPLVVMALTGITFTWGNLIFPALEKLQGIPLTEKTPSVVTAAGASKAAPDAALAVFISNHAGARLTGFQPSNQPDAPHVFHVAPGTGPSIRYLYDPYTLKEMGRFDGSGTGPAGWYRRSFGQLHTMGAQAFPIRVAWGFCSLTGAFLAVTGVWMSIRRWRRKSRADSRATV